MSRYTVMALQPQGSYVIVDNEADHGSDERVITLVGGRKHFTTRRSADAEARRLNRKHEEARQR